VLGALLLGTMKLELLGVKVAQGLKNVKLFLILLAFDL